MANTNKIQLPQFSEIERKLVNDEGQIVLEKITPDDQRRIILQIEKEWQLCWSYNAAKRKINLARLQLYNNQRRQQNTFGDPLMFTIFNTIHASLWDDRLAVSWEGRGGQGDEDVEENLNSLSTFDYDVMHKAELDYDWNWDAEFFGRGLLMLNDFDRTRGIQAPVPEVIDASTWIRDPRATSVNGDMRGRGAMRFGGREIGLSYWEMKKHPDYFNLKSLRKSKEIKSTTDEMRAARRTAQGLENFAQKEEELGKYDNYEFRLVEWVTHIKGQKYLVTLGNNRSLVVRLRKMRNQREWPIIDRPLYPISHDWDGVSIPDLTEDKQRFRAMLLNLTGVAAKSDVMPTYAFDRTKIKNQNDLNFRTNKFIPVDGSTRDALTPVTKPTIHQYVNGIMDILDAAAQRATATPEIQQGVQSKEKRTLGELELVAAKVDTRYSMSAKLYGISEAKFWRQWYRLYKQHFKDKIDEKIIRIQGATAPMWRPLMRDNIISQVDPDVKIESKVISEAKRVREQQSYTGFATVVLQDPDTNRRFVLKRMSKLQGMSKEETDLMFPPNVDELQAEDENAVLNEGKLPEINVQDNHQTHIWIHSKAKQTPHMLAHIRRHKKLMVIRRNMPDVFPPAVSPFQVGGATASPPENGRLQAQGRTPAPSTLSQ